MKTWPEMLQEFHAACGTADPDYPTIPAPEKQKLRWKLNAEEWMELATETEQPEQDIGKVAKEICDLIYVLIGMGMAYGIDMDAAFAEVHRSNMTKFPDGKVLRRPDGKILKPDTFEPADMSVIFNRKTLTGEQKSDTTVWVSEPA